MLFWIQYSLLLQYEILEKLATFIRDKLACTHVVPNCQYSIAQMCPREECFPASCVTYWVKVSSQHYIILGWGRPNHTWSFLEHPRWLPYPSKGHRHSLSWPCRTNRKKIEFLSNLIRKFVELCCRSFWILLLLLLLFPWIGPVGCLVALSKLK